MRPVYRLSALMGLMLFISFAAQAQQSVSIGTTTLDEDAVLFLVGDGSQGLIIPRTSSITSMPVKEGMVVYNNTDRKVYYCDGLNWQAVGGGSSSGTGQTLTLNGNTLSISGGNTVQLATAPATNSFFMWNGSSWVATSLTGDISNANGNVTVNAVKGKTIPAFPNTTQALVYDGTNWVFQTLNSGLSTTLNSGNIYVGNNSNTATAVAMSGDITMSNTGAVTIANNAITSGKIADGAITASDLNAMGATTAGQVLRWNGTGWAPGVTSGLSSTLNAGQIYVGNATNIGTAVTISGDASLDNAGALTLVNSGVAANTYGSTTQIPQLTVDAKGRITAVTNQNIATASGTTTGLLSSADFTTFNNKQNALTLTTTGTTGAATLTGNTLNIPQYASSYLAGSGLTLTGSTFSVNTSQSITTLSNLTSNGLVKTSGGTGALSIATPGTDYLVTETDATVRAINGMVKSNGTTISAAVAGTDYLTSNQAITLSGDISGSGSTAITTTIGTTAGNSIVSAINNVGTSGTINDNRLATIATAGKVSGSAINTGTIGGNTAINTTGAITAASFAGDGSALTNVPLTGTAGGDLTGTYPNPTLSTAAATGTSIVTAVNASPSTINGGRVSPAFGAQNISTTGTLAGGNTTVTGTLGVSGITTLTNLSGAGSRMVTADATGVLNTQAIPALPTGTSGQTLRHDGANYVSTSNLFNNGTNVGIGTATPGELLTISGASSMIGLNNTSGGQLWRVVSDTDGALKFVKTSGTTFPPLSLNSNGAIGIYDGVGATTYGTAGQVLTSGGPGAVPTWSTISGGGDMLAANNLSEITNQSTARTNLGLGTVAVVNAIADAEVSSGANIQGTKINPTFGAQNISTSGTFSAGAATVTGLTVSGATTSINGASLTWPATNAAGVLTNNGAGALTWGPTGLSSALASANIFVGNGSSIATGVPMTGDIAITNAGFTSIANSATSGTNIISAINNGGTTGTIPDSRLATISTAGKVSGSAITSGTIGGSTAINSTGNITTTGTLNTGAATVSALSIGGTTINWPANTPGVLTNNGSGTLSWGAAGWSLIGNAGTVDGTNFIGTTDNIPLNFRVNNQKAGRIDPINDNVFFGRVAGNSTTTGTWNTAMGTGALNLNVTGVGNVAIGYNALFQSTGTGGNVGIGVSSLGITTTGASNTAVGNGSMNANVSGNNNVALGANTLQTNTTGSNNTAIGYQANVSAGALTNATAIGSNASVTTSNTIQLGDAAVTTVNVGTGTTAKLVAGGLQITGGTLGAGRVLTSDASGNATWQPGGSGWNLGGNAGLTDGAIGVGNNYIGTTTSTPLNFIVNNVKAGRIDFIPRNTFLGHQAGNVLTTGTGNSGFGGAALEANTTGTENTALGFAALSLSTTSNYNTGVGARALEANTTGAGNTAVGYFSLNDNTTGSNNTAIGSEADVLSNNLNNATAIGYNAKVAASNSLVLGGTGANAVNVGINTTTPLTDIQIGNTAHLFDFPNAAALSYNLYENAGNLFHTTAGGASVIAPQNDRIGMYVNAAGAANASFGSTLTNRMVMTETGVSINKDSPDPSAVLQVVSETVGGGGIPRGFMMPSMITSDRDAIPTPLNGLMVYNQSDNQFNYYNGSAWQALGGGGSGWNLTGNGSIVDGTHFIGTTADVPLTFRVFNQQAGRIETATGNAFMGYLAGNNNTGSYNVALGGGALQANTNSSQNTAIGNAALMNSLGGMNTAVGQAAMIGNTSGAGNTAVGVYALHDNASGTNNTAIGRDALYNVTGNGNTGVGYLALGSAGSSTNSTAIGHGATVNTGLTNATAIGYSALASTNNTVILGGTGANAVNVGIGTSNPSNTLTALSSATVGYTTAALRYGDLTGSGYIGAGTTNSFSLWDNSGNQQVVVQQGTGNVGIGLSNPIEPLHVNGTSTGRIRVTTTSQGTTSSDGVELDVNSAGEAHLFNRDGGNLVLGTGNGSVNQVVFITPGGLVGLNNAAPTAPLDVSGGVKMGTITVTGGLPDPGDVLTATDTQGNATWQTSASGFNLSNQVPRGDGTTTVSSNIFSNGTNVSIGTSATTYPLTLEANAVGYMAYYKNLNNGAYSKLVLDGTGTGGGYLSLNSGGPEKSFMYTDGTNTLLGSSGGSAGEVRLFSNGTQQMVIDAGGNVGVGTTTPTSKIHVSSTNIGIRTNSSTDWGGYFEGNSGVYTQGNNIGVQANGVNSYGLSAHSLNGDGLRAEAANTANYAAHFEGKINITGEVNRPSTGAANMIPIAYGVVDNSGNLLTSSGNVSVFNSSNGDHQITITGETYSTSGYITTVTLMQNGVGGQQNFHWTEASGGTLRVRVVNASGGSPSGVWTGYHFVVYKP